MFAIMFSWDPGMKPEAGERYWLGKHAERTPDRSGGCKFYCDRQNIAMGFKTIEGGLSAPGRPHWDGANVKYAITD